MIKIRKFTQQEVEKIFENNNCKLLDNYKDARTSMKYKCVCGEIVFDLDNSQIKKSTEIIEYNYGKISRLI